LNLWRGNPSGGAPRSGTIVIALACVAWFGAPVNGQQAPGAPAKPGAPTAPAPWGGSQVESNPIRCWWKTDKDAIRVGEPFTLALTCGLVETDAVRVVVDPARLDPAALEMTPFDVLGGTRERDIPAPPRRYFQYSYTLRLLADGFFGRDVDIPSLPLTYRVQSTRGDAAQGREQLYLLPALPVRVLSLVPVTATDIHDAAPDTFADIESRTWRATQEFAAAAILLVFAAVLAGLATIRAVGRAREGQSAAVAPVPAHAVLRACEREAQRIRLATAAGWTPDLIERSLSAFRLGAAVAVGRSVAETPVDRRSRPGEGQLAVDKGLWRPQRVLISASTTAARIAAQLANEGEEPGSGRRETLEDIAAPLHVLGTAYYSRSGQLDAEALDSALDRGMRGLHRLRFATPWPARAADALARIAAALREATWAR
jgi:hypothetical protein